mgnify:CR=1 FL=1
MQLLCVATGLVMYGLAAAVGKADEGLAGGYLERGDYGSDPVVYDFVVEGLADKPLDCQAVIHPVQYGKEEAEAVLDQIISQLPDRIKGMNPSLAEVRTDLELPSGFSEYGVSIRWESQNPDILDSFGRIRIEECPQEGKEVILKARLTHGMYEKEVPLTLQVYPERRTQEEMLSDVLQRQIQEADSIDRTQKKVKLPREYEGKNLIYRQKQDKSSHMFLILGPLAAFLLYAREKKEEEEKNKKRDQKLLLDYADVVYQLMVFIGAGLTVGQAWERIVLSYKTRKKDNRCQERPVYEEMAAALGQMQCGQPEGKAILDFGKRCKLQPYLKLTTLLEQNRRTGTKNLQQVLEQEMIAAWEQQKNVARRMGEEAGTKLLLPLFLMLFVVMVLVMVPAMMAMG